MANNPCILEDDKLCDNCCECYTCDLDSNKSCDNCAKCLEFEEEYRSYTLRDLVVVEEAHKKTRLQKAKLMLKLHAKNINFLSRRRTVTR